MPTPFTFEETNGGTGGSTTVQGSGGETIAASSATSSGTGGAPPMCEIGYECVEEVFPPGWIGPALVRVSPKGDLVPPCMNGEEALLFPAKPSMAPHGCDKCSCSNPTATCSAPHIQCFYGDSLCAGAAGVQKQLTSPSCAADATAPVAEDQAGSCKLIGGPVVVNQGLCVKSTSAVMGPQDYEEDVSACMVPTAGTCGENLRCVQSPSDGARLCIGKEGEDECPAGWPDKVPAFGKVSDQRACSACGCDTLTCSGGQYTVGDAAMCDVAGAATVVVNSTDCTEVNLILDGASASFKPVLGKLETVTCTGGEPEGSVVATDPLVFCCKPPSST